MVGLVIDSILFLQIAFGSLDFIEGQIIGMLWTTVFAVVVLLALRRWVIPRYSRPADEPTVPEAAWRRCRTSRQNRPLPGQVARS